MELTLRAPPELVEEIAQRAAALVLAQLTADEADPEYFTVAEAAAYLRCSRQRIYDLLSSRRLPKVKEGTRVLIARSALRAYLGDDSAL